MKKDPVISFSLIFKQLTRTGCCCLIVSLLGSCIAGKAKVVEEKSKKTEAQPAQMVGRIASIPADQRFALIQSYGKWEVPTGSILTTRGNGERTANLLATGENLGQYAAADIQAGDVQVGDGVYYRPVVKVPEVTETVAPRQPVESQKPIIPDNPSQENVQKNN